MSHRGFRALAVLVISTSFLFASQNFHGTVPGIDSNLAPTHSVDHKNAAAPVHHGADQLAKRVAIPFGHVATNNFNSPPDQKPGDILHKPVLVKRKTWKLEVDVAICKGKKLLQTMADASHNAPRTVNMANLKINGWTVSDVELQHLPAPVVAAMRAYGVDTADTKQRNAMLDHPFPKDGRMQENDYGIYNNGYNVKRGAIVAIENASPEYCVQQVPDPPTGAALAALVPDIQRWSDVVFGIWADTAGSVMSHSLNYIFRDNVVNEDTKHIMDVVMGLGSDVPTGNLHATYPGCEFSTDTWQGLALLGTPHGGGIAWFLIDWVETLGKRKVKIRAYTGIDETNGRNQYFLIFDIAESA